MPCVAREILLNETFQQCSFPLFCGTTAKKVVPLHPKTKQFH